MNPFPTSKENIALDLIFGLLGASRINRTMDEYMDVASRAPKVEVMHADVNKVLREMAAAGYAPYEICYFKKKTTNILGFRNFRPPSREKQSERCGLSLECGSFNWSTSEFRPSPNEAIDFLIVVFLLMRPFM